MPRRDRPHFEVTQVAGNGVPAADGVSQLQRMLGVSSKGGGGMYTAMMAACTADRPALQGRRGMQACRVHASMHDGTKMAPIVS